MIESKASLDIQTGEIVIDINLRPDVAVQSSLFQQIINTMQRTASVEVKPLYATAIPPGSHTVQEGYASLKIKLKGQGVKSSSTTVVRSEPAKTATIPAVKI